MILPFKLINLASFFDSDYDFFVFAVFRWLFGPNYDKGLHEVRLAESNDPNE